MLLVGFKSYKDKFTREFRLSVDLATNLNLTHRHLNVRQR